VNGSASCDTHATGCKPIIGDTGWRFCASPDCDVVYFSEEGDTIYTRSQLKVPVGVKERSGERPLCYCFGHSVASIKEELRTKGRSDALEDIRAKMKDPGCRCEVTNPSGSCCLGSVARGIEIARAELEAERNASELQPSAGVQTHQPNHDDQGLAMAKPAPALTENSEPKKNAFLATLAALFVAIVGSACCWLPLLLIAFGFSAVGVTSFFEQYRPYFLIVAFALLALAWYFTYQTVLWRIWRRLRGTPAEHGWAWIYVAAGVLGDPLGWAFLARAADT
jgi:hypothetical protein